MLALTATCFPVFAQSSGGSWEQKASVNAPGRFWAFAFSVGGKGYAGTGVQGFSGNPIADFWEYDPATDTWAQKADVPGGPREGMDGFAIGDKGYAAFGTSFIAFSSDLYQYDPASNTWATKASVPGGVGFAYSHGFVIDSTYYIGPENGTNKMYAYHAGSNSWTAKADYPGLDRRAQVAFAADGKGYIGAGAFVFGGARKDFFQYDPTTDTWTQIADVDRASDQSSGFSIGKYGYMYNVGGNLKEVYRYVPATNEWVFEASKPNERIANASFFTIDGDAYLIFGERTISGGNAPSSELWKFTPGILSSLDPSGINREQVSAHWSGNAFWVKINGLKSLGGNISLRDLSGRELGKWAFGRETDVALQTTLPEMAGGVYLLTIQQTGLMPFTAKVLHQN